MEPLSRHSSVGYKVSIYWNPAEALLRTVLEYRTVVNITESVTGTVC